MLPGLIIVPMGSSGGLGPIDNIGRIPAMTASATSGVTITDTSHYSGSDFWMTGGYAGGKFSQANGATSTNVLIDFGAGNLFAMQQLSYWGRSAGNNPTQITVFFSDDGISYTQLYNVTGLNGSLAANVRADLTWTRDARPHRFWKLYLFTAATYVGWNGYQLYT